jgi:hypothetical protein
MHVGPALVKGILSIIASATNGSSWGVTPNNSGGFDVFDDTWDSIWKTVLAKDTEKKDKMSTFQKALVTPMNGVIGDILIDLVTDDDVVRMVKNRIQARGSADLDALQLARLIIKYPALEEAVPLTDIKFDHLVVMATEYPTRFLSKLDVSQLNTLHYRYMFNSGHKAVMKHVYKKSKKEELQKLSTDTWLKLLRVIPSAGKHLKIDRIRNQTELRRLIEERPTLMRYATLDQMQKSPIKPETWARILANMKPKYRAMFPVGSKEWIEKAIFVRQLKGNRFKDFKEWASQVP